MARVIVSWAAVYLPATSGTTSTLPTHEESVAFADSIDVTVLRSGLGNFYPEWAQWEGTELVPRSGIMSRVATNGAVRLRALQSVTKYDPVVVHGFLSRGDRNTLLSFYDTNRTSTFTFVAQEDGVPRLCVFAPTPFRIAPVPGMPNAYSATVYLLEA